MLPALHPLTRDLICAPQAGAVEALQVFAAALAAPTMRDKLALLEQTIGESGAAVELPVQHHFARGVYARELFIPKGTVLVGKIHKFSQINVVTRGEISVLTDTGIRRVRAGEVIVSGPGTKRAGYAHEDTVWLTIHGTHETDLERLEDELIAANFEEFDKLCAVAALEG